MNASDLNRVNELMEKYKDNLKKNKMLKGLLSGYGYPNSNVKHPHQVRIEIGGDQSGNGRYKTVTTNLQDVEYVVRLIDKEISDCWGEIVAIRTKLRDLGVNIDDN